MRPTKAACTDAHVNLRRLYDERAPVDMTQEEFGKKYAIGTQGMVWQYLSGRRPLNLEAAAKFARGLRCTIYDISPEMAEALTQDVMPVLAPRAWWRKHLAKVSMLLLLASPAIAPTPVAPTPVEESAETGAVYYVKFLLRFLRRLTWWKHQPPRIAIS